LGTTDILILVGILLYAALGVRDGFFRKLYGIIVFVVALIAATKLMAPFSEFLINSMEFSETTAIILAIFIVFIGVIIIASLLYRWFGKSASDTINIWSRIFGGVLGFAQGIVAVSLILVMLGLFDIPSKEDKEGSALYEDVYQVTPNILDYTTRWLPSSKRFLDEIKEIIGQVKIP
jgi:membrane protein required for colicin V production